MSWHLVVVAAGGRKNEAVRDGASARYNGSRMRCVIGIMFCLVASIASAAPRPGDAPGGGVVSGSPKQPPQVRPFDLNSLPHYETKYYVIYTDLDRDSVQDVAVRITKMAEVYRDRTRDFSGSIRRKLPFVLFKNRE